MITFLHNYLPNPILFQFENIKIRWYGFLMVVAIILGIYIVTKIGKKYRLSKDDIFDMAFYCILFGLIGARIYYVLYSWSYYQNHLIDILKIWEGGLAIHGVIIGGFLTVFFFCKIKKISFGLMADVLVPALSLGQVIGRWGNYFNQEIFGKPTNFPWGIPIEVQNRPEQYLGFQYFHPTFLYESILNIFIFIILLLLHFRRWKNQEAKVYNGNIFVVYLTLYSLVRFFMEFLRTDSSPLIYGIRWAQVLSAAIIFFGIIFLAARSIKNKSLEE